MNALRDNKGFGSTGGATLTIGLTAVLLLLIAGMYFLGVEARTYGEFCRGNGYEAAIKLAGGLACAQKTDFNTTFQMFDCEGGACAFNDEPQTLQSNKIRGIEVDLNA